MKMLWIEFVLMRMVLQMKAIKVNDNTQNIPHKEFQRYVESESIEVSTEKMHPCQFVSMMAVTQMK
jgi:hypothetical protein